MTGDPTSEPVAVAEEAVGRPPILALAGAALLALSCAFAWVARDFLSPAAGLMAQDISVPSLLATGTLLQIPSVAQLVMSIALAAGGLAVARTGDPVRRVLGALAVVVAAFVAVRLNTVFGHLPDWSPIGSLRLGIYLAAVGGVLTLVARGSEAPRRTALPRLALAGVVLVLLSAVVAWAVQPFAPQEVPVEAGAISVPFLLTQAFVRFPTAAQVIVPAGVVAAALLVWPTTTAWDVVRRVMGAVAVIVAGLFLLRLWQALGPAPDDRVDFIDLIRFGAPLALIGGILTAVAGRFDRRPRSP